MEPGVFIPEPDKDPLRRHPTLWYVSLHSKREPDFFSFMPEKKSRLLVKDS